MDDKTQASDPADLDLAGQLDSRAETWRPLLELEGVVADDVAAAARQVLEILRRPHAAGANR